MTIKTLQGTLEATGETYAALALQKQTIDAQMGVLKRFLVDGIGVGNEIVGDSYVISISPGDIIKSWTKAEDKALFEATLVKRGLLKLEAGPPRPIIKFKGDIT